MNSHIEIRRNDRFRNRIENANLFFYFSQEDDSENYVNKVLHNFDLAFETILNGDDSEKEYNLNIINQLVKTNQKYIYPKINEDIIIKFCSLFQNKELSLTVLRLLTSLVQIDPICYNTLKKINFYQAINEIINEDIDPLLYRQILILLGDTLKKNNSSIHFFYEIGIIEKLLSMKQTQNIEQLQCIYSFALLDIPDFNILPYILHFLTFAKEKVIKDSLEILQKCLCKYNKTIWNQLIYDERLASTLLNYQNNSNIFPLIVNCYSYLCSSCDEAISAFFSNDGIIQLIKNNISQYIISNDCYEVHSKKFNSFYSILNLILSICVNSSSETNITNIYEFIDSLKLASLISSFNYKCQAIIYKIILVLTGKVSFDQAERLFTKDIISSVFSFMINSDSESFDFFKISIQAILDKYSIYTDFVETINQFLVEYDLVE